jgi:hypothetical protein
MRASAYNCELAPDRQEDVRSECRPSPCPGQASTSSAGHTKPDTISTTTSCFELLARCLKEARRTCMRNKRVDSAVWRCGRCIRFGYRDNGGRIRLWGRKALPHTQHLLRRDRLMLLEQRFDIGLDNLEPSAALRASSTSAALLFRLAIQLRLKEQSLERRVLASVHRSKKDTTANDERR